MQKHIEFHLPHYKIPQLSPRYCSPCVFFQLIPHGEWLSRLAPYRIGYRFFSQKICLPGLSASIAVFGTDVR